jgi:hypothetical protein
MSPTKQRPRTLLAILVSATLLGATGLWHGVHASAPSPAQAKMLLAGGGNPIPPGPG